MSTSGLTMCIGSPITISFLVVLVRKHYFCKHYEDLIRHEAEVEQSPTGTCQSQDTVNPMGEWTNSDTSKALPRDTSSLSHSNNPSGSPSLLLPISPGLRSSSAIQPSRRRRLSDPATSPFLSKQAEKAPMRRYEIISAAAREHEVEPNQWLQPRVEKNSRSKGRSFSGGFDQRRGNSAALGGHHRGHSVEQQLSLPCLQRLTEQEDARLSHFGESPMPHTINRFIDRVFPNPHQSTIVSQRLASDIDDQSRRHAPCAPPSAIVGRNSMLHLVSEQQAEDIGGIEYRALNALLWVVPTYYIGLQLVAFMITALYISQPKWVSSFISPALVKPVPVFWFAIFQTTSAINNTGMSLVDQSFVPFQAAYPMVFLTIFLVLAGNTAYPIFLRFMIWSISQMIPKISRLYETLSFLLDHPRRCYFYLFSSQHTYLLLGVVTLLTFSDWFCFMVLNIGNDVIDSIPLGMRFVDGLFQSVAVRSAGFGIVSMAALSPAAQFAYVVMMYLSVFPIALSVRPTNVYKEHSLGIYPSDMAKLEFNDKGADHDRMTVWRQCLNVHFQKQLAFDMWWLAVALWLICIIERTQIMDDSREWFSVFSILFELVSACGTVGLSLGIPNQNYSLSGSFSTLSKLVICLVMLRGRHRGLPAAMDRAVLLPAQLQLQDEAASIYRTYTVAGSSTNPCSDSSISKTAGRMSLIGEAQTLLGSVQESSSGDLLRRRPSGVHAIV